MTQWADLVSRRVKEKCNATVNSYFLGSSNGLEPAEITINQQDGTFEIFNDYLVSVGINNRYDYYLEFSDGTAINSYEIMIKWIFDCDSSEIVGKAVG